MSVLIKNGRIITVADDYIADIFIEGETVSTIGKNLQVKSDEVIEGDKLDDYKDESLKLNLN